jgi:hypothetical protein
MTTQWIAVGERVKIELLADAHGDWQGVGEVLVDGQRLRDGRLPLVLRLDTPDGVLYTRFRLEGVDADGDAVAVRLRAFGFPWGRQEYMDEYEQPLYNLQLGSTPAEDAVTLHFAPITRQVGDRTWAGFTYRIAFASDTRQIHRVLVHGSWELGGAITGNTVLQQGQCNMPVYAGAVDTLFTTTCLKTLQQYGSPLGVSFQLAPRGGLVQGFDFQYGPAGALLQRWPVFTAISSVIESPVGCDRLHVADEYRFPLASQAETVPQEVLYTPGPLAEHEAHNLWWEALEAIYGGIRAAHGIINSVVRPELGKAYSTRVVGDRLRMTVGGVEVDSTEVPYALADHVLPQLAKMGIRRFWPEVMSMSDVTEMGMRRKCDEGIHGGFTCSSVCATHRFLPADYWGGLPAWKYMADKAHALGIEIGTWFAPHFSANAAIFQEHPEWRLTGPASTAFGGGYGFTVINMVDWHTGFFDWVLADITRWVNEAGLDYLWSDSYSNLGLLMPNYAAAMRNNAEPLARLYGEFSKLGLKNFSYESVSPFGLMACGFSDLRGDLFGQDHSVAGQNDFGWWVGHEDMAFNTCMYQVHTRKRSEEELQGIQFRMMANRGFVMLNSLITGNYQLPEWWMTLNHTYEQALPYMKKRLLLPDGAGVLWLSGGTQVLWAFRDSDMPVAAGTEVVELLGTEARPVAHGTTLALRGGCVYRVG